MTDEQPTQTREEFLASLRAANAERISALESLGLSLNPLTLLHYKLDSLAEKIFWLISETEEDASEATAEFQIEFEEAVTEYIDMAKLEYDRYQQEQGT